MGEQRQGGHSSSALQPERPSFQMKMTSYVMPSKFYFQNWGQLLVGGCFTYLQADGVAENSLVAPDDTGYTGRILKAASRGGKNLFIVPIQEELSTNPLQLTDEAFSSMPKATCQKCGVAVPLHLLTEHIKSCGVIDVGSDDNLDSAAMQQCPVCTEMFPTDFIEVHASSCGESAGNEVMHESTVNEEEQAAMPGPSGTCVTVTDGWLTISDPTKAISQCANNFCHILEMESPLLLSMDIRSRLAEQDMALISFYKRPNVEWARPLNCRLEEDHACRDSALLLFMSCLV
ncbi:uncharacterized protein LOC127444597 [Myxocyprinus asiaticus]|uniref:uncharacterized protein LOC127444597 n=1 Tax=Myxocyprinus asiaticus TaxID=70543 RepID=UPI00222174EF|nr:uncharacterized protein LOC127444597 [Myxocyprinus asiaticus]